jgi:uncharacterized protein with HEPN domain
MPPTPRERVAHILDAITTIEERVHGVDLQAFADDDQLHDSVLYQIARIGEAVANLDEATVARHPTIPWQQIRGMRNRVMHEYHSVSLRIVWNTIKVDLPVLRSAIEQELREEKKSTRRPPTV